MSSMHFSADMANVLFMIWFYILHEYRFRQTECFQWLSSVGAICGDVCLRGQWGESIKYAYLLVVVTIAMKATLRLCAGKNWCSNGERVLCVGGLGYGAMTMRAKHFLCTIHSTYVVIGLSSSSPTSTWYLWHSTAIIPFWWYNWSDAKLSAF